MRRTLMKHGGHSKAYQAILFGSAGNTRVFAFRY